MNDYITLCYKFYILQFMYYIRSDYAPTDVWKTVVVFLKVSLVVWLKFQTYFVHSRVSKDKTFKKKIVLFIKTKRCENICCLFVIYK